MFNRERERKYEKKNIYCFYFYIPFIPLIQFYFQIIIRFVMIFSVFLEHTNFNNI